MTSLDLLLAGGLVGFAVFFFASGHFVGYRRATRKHLPALLLAAKTPPKADLGNTVARTPQRPDAENTVGRDT